MIPPHGFWPILLDLWRAGRGRRAGILARQAARFKEMFAFARARSPLYKRLYSRLPEEVEDVRCLPPVTKAELMADFESWVTDPQVRLGDVEAFVEDPARVGHSYLDRYAVWRTSGVSGQPGIFLHDSQALKVYGALALWRGLRPWISTRRLAAILTGGGRIAALVATGGHFAGPAIAESLRNLHAWFGQRTRIFSVLTPLTGLVEALNEFQPALLVSYPTVLSLLAAESSCGRLRIDPALVVSAAEWLSGAMRGEIAAAFNCPLRDLYAASEFMGLAYDCPQGWLHLNADWVVLEAVDRDYQPVPPGEVSHTALLTNLVNKVQPILRYDLGDSLLVRPEPCECGSPLTAIRVQGRRDEILYLQSRQGGRLPLLPMALAVVAEETPGVQRFQIIQVAQERLSVRLLVAPGADETQVWGALARNLGEYLSEAGLPSVILERDPQMPLRDPSSGKYRQVWSNL